MSLTPEQIRLRIRDNEVRELKKENEALKARIRKMLQAFIDLIRSVAPRLHWTHAAELNKITSELEKEVECIPK